MSEEAVVRALARAYATDVEPRFVHTRLCVLAARIGAGVLDYFGVGNRVVPVEMMVFNDAAAEELKADRPIEEWPPEAWSIGITRDAPGPGYAGHLLIETEEGRLVDLSARQFDRRGLLDIDGPRVWESDEVVLTGLRPGERIAHEPNVTWLWTPFSDASYRRAPDWRSGAEDAGRIIRSLRPALA